MRVLPNLENASDIHVVVAATCPEMKARMPEHLQPAADWAAGFGCSYVAVIVAQRLLWNEALADEAAVRGFFRDLANVDESIRKRARLDTHLADDLVGTIAMDYLAAHGRVVCAAPAAVQ